MSVENEDDSSVMEASDSIIESEKKQRILYTRDFLLSLSELEVCKSLPSGFDQSILREFGENRIQERVKTHGILYTRDFLLSLSELEVCKSLPRGFDQSILKEFGENRIQERVKTHGNVLLQGFRRSDYSSSPPTRGDSSNFSRGGYGRWDNRSSGRSDKDGDAQSDLDPDSGRPNYGNHSRRPWQNSEHDGLLGSGSFPRPSGFAGGTSASKGSSNERYHLNRSTEAYQPPRPFKAVLHSRPNTHDSFNDETFGSSESTSQDRSEEERKRRASFELMRKEQQKVLQEKQKTSANKVKNDDFTDLILEEAKEEGVSEASGELNSAVQSVPKDDSGKSNILLQSSKPRPLVPPGFKSTGLEKSCTEKEQSTKPGIEEILLLAKGNHTQNETLDNKGSIHSGDHHPNRISGFPEVHEAVDGEVFELITNKITGSKIRNLSQENTTSILGKLFGSEPTIKDGGPTGFPEKVKLDDSLSPHNVQSSRFAQWFNEDEKKHVDGFSSSRPNDLLSLIGGGEKANPIAPELSYKGFGITKTPSDPKHVFDNFRQELAPPPVAAVLTCEDLEQTIMSEYSEKSSNLLPPVRDWSISGQGNVDARAVNSQATHHLLSVLKGSVVDNGSNTNVGPVEAHSTSENPKDGNSNLGQNLSLEALFGTAFMKELQSDQAPVSAQRAPPAHDLSVSNVDRMGPAMKNYETRPLSSNQKQPAKSDDPENWLHFNGQRVEVDPSVFGKQTIRTGEIQLPEEESSVIVGDDANTRNSNIGKMLPADVAFDVSEKLAVLNSGFRGHGPYEMLEPERRFNNNQNQRLMLHASDTNPQQMNSQMRFLDQLMHRDNTPINRKMPRNMHVPPFHHPDARVAGLDIPINGNIHPQMLPQMRMQGTFPPPQLLHDLQRPQASNFMPDNGVPFAHQQSNIGGPGFSFSVPVADGTNHPEAFRRMEMELQAQSKQVRPVSTGHGQGYMSMGLH